jgi:hypothetical protein
MATATVRSITDRMLGALRLDDATYEEIEADTKATGEAAFVVVGSSAAAAAGSALLVGGAADGGIVVAVAELIGWALYAWCAYLIGAKVFKAPQTTSTWGELARTLGYANTPRFLLFFVFVPGLTGLVRIVTGLWVLVATVVALRSALDCGTGRAIVVGIIASIVQLVIVWLALSALGA